jgi:hypothetical protein
MHNYAFFEGRQFRQYRRAAPAHSCAAPRPARRALEWRSAAHSVRWVISRVRWQKIDDRSAQTTLSNGSVAVTMTFTFQEDGLIDTVRAEARGRVVGGKSSTAPWQGRFWNYALRNGMRIPLESEVSWMLPEGVQTYWRGKVTALSHEFAKD